MKNYKKGIYFIILSAFCFSLMNLFVKLSGNLPAIQKAFFRNLIALLVAAFLLWKSHTPFHYQKGNLKLLLARSLFGTIGILCNFYAIDHLNLSDASMLNKLSPFFVIIFSYFFLQEKIKPTQVLCVFLAFIGSLFIIKPSFYFAEIMPSLLGFAGGMAAGAAYTVVRILGLSGEKSTFIVFFFSSFSCLVTLPYIVFSYTPMTMQQLFFLLLAGLCASGGQFAITTAYTYAPGREISIYDYTIVIFAGIWSFIFWSETPDLLSIIGYAIVFIASLIMFFHNKTSKAVH